jgi:hypothetical protein
MEKFSVAILIFVCITATVDAMTIRCYFGSNTYSYVTGTFYKCAVENTQDFTASLVSIDSAVGTHTGDHENDDVTEFKLGSVSNLVHFPKNIEKVFPDLEAIVIYYTKLQAITQDDLKMFPRLKVAYFTDNQLKVITADTFRFNPKLERIDLDHNLIFHIEPHTFDGLPMLTAIHLQGNDDNCHLTRATTKSDTAALVQKVNNRKCYSLAYEVEQKHEKHLKDEQQQIEILKKQMQQIEKQMEDFDVLMSQMLIQIQILTKKVENIH